MNGTAITYRGRDRNDGGRCGSTTDSPAVLIKRLFDQRWRWAVVERDGVQVAAIARHPDTGKRGWWAET